MERIVRHQPEGCPAHDASRLSRARCSSKGCVLNTSSLVGVIGQEIHAAYTATKGGLNALTKSMALDYAKHGIRVNAVCPAGAWTPMLRQWCQGATQPRLKLLSERNSSAGLLSGRRCHCRCVRIPAFRQGALHHRPHHARQRWRGTRLSPDALTLMIKPGFHAATRVFPSATVTAAMRFIATRFIPTPSRNCTTTKGKSALVLPLRWAKAINWSAKRQNSTRNDLSANHRRNHGGLRCVATAQWPTNNNSAGSVRTKALCNSRWLPSQTPAGICGPRRGVCRSGNCSSIYRRNKSSPRSTFPISKTNLTSGWR